MVTQAGRGKTPDRTVPSVVVAGQTKVAVTGTAVALPDHALVNGVVVRAKLANVADIYVGASDVNRTDDGTGTGYKLVAGDVISFAVDNTNVIWINGSANDVVYFAGN